MAAAAARITGLVGKYTDSTVSPVSHKHRLALKMNCSQIRPQGSAVAPAEREARIAFVDGMISLRAGQAGVQELSAANAQQICGQQ